MERKTKVPLLPKTTSWAPKPTRHLHHNNGDDNNDGDDYFFADAVRLSGFAALEEEDPVEALGGGDRDDFEEEEEEVVPVEAREDGRAGGTPLPPPSEPRPLADTRDLLLMLETLDPADGVARALGSASAAAAAAAGDIERSLARRRGVGADVPAEALSSFTKVSAP